MVDVVLYIVHRHSLSSLLKIPTSQIISMINDKSLREKRPKNYKNFHRDFDVDIEGEILEIFDSNPSLTNSNENVLSSTLEIKNDIILLLAKWCSIAQWTCWDARLFLYVEPYVDIDIFGVSDFLKSIVWRDFGNAISKFDQETFSETIILDWMNRREELGETMEPSEDPIILPTMNSHSNLSKSLFEFINHSKNVDFDLLVGREYLDSELWGLGNNYLSKYGANSN